MRAVSLGNAIGTTGGLGDTLGTAEGDALLSELGVEEAPDEVGWAMCVGVGGCARQARQRTQAQETGPSKRGRVTSEQAQKAVPGRRAKATPT
ncbi:unnamed protein product [Ilex paraguariensis]|uniref:Uncharacterized protein n=1 Tax=Ilex paraguariensis TaxID=185542 RepID=A0ABC8R9X1_9AQUA